MRKMPQGYASPAQPASRLPEVPPGPAPGARPRDGVPLDDALQMTREAIRRLEVRDARPETPVDNFPLPNPGPVMADPFDGDQPPRIMHGGREFVPVELFRARRSIPLGEPIRWYLLITDMENYRRDYGDHLGEIWALIDEGRLDEAEARFDRRTGVRDYV